MCHDIVLMHVQGTKAYVPQHAWIQNMTLRDNILFGDEYHETRYKETLRCCQLKHDLTILPSGDRTEIGEKVTNQAVDCKHCESSHTRNSMHMYMYVHVCIQYVK